LLCADPPPLPFELCEPPERLRADWLRPRVRELPFDAVRVPPDAPRERERERELDAEREPEPEPGVADEPLSGVAEASPLVFTERDACVAAAARVRPERFDDAPARFVEDERVLRVLAEALLPFVRPPPDAAPSPRAAVPAPDLLRDVVLPR
jgi:hypothetical protein